jgi:hypothetical protein
MNANPSPAPAGPPGTVTAPARSWQAGPANRGSPEGRYRDGPGKPSRRWNTGQQEPAAPANHWRPA